MMKMKMNYDPVCMQLSALAMAWIGVFFTLIANFFCTFTVQEISVNVTDPIDQQNTTSVPIGPYYAGIWNYKTYNTVWSARDGTIYVDTYATCAKYPEVGFKTIA
jgi:hypothetical protein